MYPVVKPGETNGQKEACRLLIDLMNEYSLFQIVDKPTRNSNILDLIFTDNPDAMSPIRTACMKPHSDHRLISTKITTHSTTQQDLPPAALPEAATYNLHRADKEKLSKEIKEVNWKEELAKGKGAGDMKS